MIEGILPDGKMRLLFISSFYLFPGTRFGGSKRLYYFAREWERTADLTLICMDACREWEPGASPRADFREFLMLPGAKSPDIRGRLMKSPADRREALRERQDEILAFLRGKRFDAILLAFPWALSFMGTYLDTADTPITYLEDDLYFEQFRKAAASGSPVKRFLKSYRFRQTLGYYRMLMPRMARYIGISPQETEVMARHFPGLRTHVVQYGIPLAEFPLLELPRNEKVIGFIGNYNHPPNLDSLNWLSETLMEAIRSRSPGARFILAGKGIPATIRERHKGDARVEFRENVEDLASFYSEIGLFLNPIRTGRGLRTKVIEAAAYGRPIVTTALGAEGLEKLEMEIEGGDAAIAAACARIWESSASRGRILRNRQAVETWFSLEKTASDLLSLLAGTSGRK